MRRRKARQLAMQTIFAFGYASDPIDHILRRIPSVTEPATQLNEFARSLCETTAENLQRIDAEIAGAIENWEPERVARVDRAILRLAVCELLFFDDIPPRTTIDEYIEIAKTFGDDQSSSFVNGVLDKIHQEHEKSLAAKNKS